MYKLIYDSKNSSFKNMQCIQIDNFCTLQREFNAAKYLNNVNLTKNTTFLAKNINEIVFNKDHSVKEIDQKIIN